MIKKRHTTILAIALVLGSFSASDAEYLIYLKGGHFIVADDCTFRVRKEVGKTPEGDERSILTEDCTKGKPEGQIFWSTINGNFGEVSADDAYAIFGTKSLLPIKPSGTTMPLEDYLITNRGDSFVNSKGVPEENGAEVYGMKRDELIKVDRRGVIEIAPERLAKSRSEGLCPGQKVEFGVSETELVGDHLLGVITNLSKEPWAPQIEVEIRVKGRRKGKFPVKDSNVLDPYESTSFDEQLKAKDIDKLEWLKLYFKDPEAPVKLCYRKLQTGTKGSN
jgi:hypothetical protein